MLTRPIVTLLSHIREHEQWRETPYCLNWQPVEFRPLLELLCLWRIVKWCQLTCQKTTSHIGKMADGPSKSDINAIFKRLRSIPTNKVCFKRADVIWKLLNKSLISSICHKNVYFCRLMWRVETHMWHTFEFSLYKWWTALKNRFYVLYVCLFQLFMQLYLPLMIKVRFVVCKQVWSVCQIINTKFKLTAWN